MSNYKAKCCGKVYSDTEIADKMSSGRDTFDCDCGESNAMYDDETFYALFEEIEA